MEDPLIALEKLEIPDECVKNIAKYILRTVKEKKPARYNSVNPKPFAIACIYIAEISCKGEEARTQHEIAKNYGITPHTLRKYYTEIACLFNLEPVYECVPNKDTTKSGKSKKIVGFSLRDHISEVYNEEYYHPEEEILEEFKKFYNSQKI